MIPVQAAIGGKIIARETIKGFKKDVLTKIHGGGATDEKENYSRSKKRKSEIETIWSCRNTSRSFYWCIENK